MRQIHTADALHALTPGAVVAFVNRGESEYPELADLHSNGVWHLTRTGRPLGGADEVMAELQHWESLVLLLDPRDITSEPAPQVETSAIVVLGVD